MDLFELEAVQLLRPQRVIVGHDRSGSGWYLDKIVVKEARNAKKEFVFPCDRSVRTLPPFHLHHITHHFVDVTRNHN